MIKVSNLKKEFIQGQERTEVLKGFDLNVEEGNSEGNLGYM